MLSEPKSKQSDSKKVHQFVVLNHILFSNMATVATTLVRKEPRLHPHQVITAAKHALSQLKEVAAKSEGVEIIENNFIPSVQPMVHEPDIISADDVLLKNQFDFISRTVKDIEKIVTTIT